MGDKRRIPYHIIGSFRYLKNLAVIVLQNTFTSLFPVSLNGKYLFM